MLRPSFCRLLLTPASKLKLGSSQNNFSTHRNLLTSQTTPLFKNYNSSPIVSKILGLWPAGVSKLYDLRSPKNIDGVQKQEKSSSSSQLLLPTSSSSTSSGAAKSPSVSYSSSASCTCLTAREGKMKIIIFYGSTRDGRYVDRVGKFVKKTLEDIGGLELTVLDPLHMKFEMLKKPFHFYKDSKTAPSWMKHVNTQIKNADGFFIISTEYNSLPPPALLNMLDHFPPSSYGHRPTALLTYSMGMFGGARAGGALRSLMSDLGMIQLPFSVNIPQVGTIFEDASGKCGNELTVKNIQHLSQLLRWYADGLKKVRRANPLPQLS